MRLNFSTTDHMNTDISDERGFIYYTISTPPGPNKVTTITKYDWNGSNSSSAVPETMGTIEWRRLGGAAFQFNGKVIPADKMLKKRSSSAGRYFVGPDQHTYKWKLRSHCLLKPAGSDVQLVRFHQKNLGISKPPHPAYLDVSPQVVLMLDHVIITFVYVEWLRLRQERSQGSQVNPAVRASLLSPPPPPVFLPPPPPPPPPAC